MLRTLAVLPLALVIAVPADAIESAQIGVNQVKLLRIQLVPPEVRFSRAPCARN